MYMNYHADDPNGRTQQYVVSSLCLTDYKKNAECFFIEMPSNTYCASTSVLNI